MNRSAPVSTFQFSVIDFESAGELPGQTDVPIQVGITTRDSQGSIVEDDLRSYIFTNQPISWRASKVHGIKKEDLHSAPKFSDLWPQISDRLSGRIVVAHNAGTEKKFLGHFPFHRFGPWIDTLELSRKLFPNLKSHGLSDLIEIFKLEEPLKMAGPTLTFHDALYDSIGTWLLMSRIFETANLWDCSLETVLDLCGSQHK